MPEFIIGGTRSGKTSMMIEQLEHYAEKHPLGHAEKYNGMILLHPGPGIVKGEVVSRAREVSDAD